VRFAIIAVIAIGCAPSRDSVLKDVERNYTATGFLDTSTFQVQCSIDSKSDDRESLCRKKMVDELVGYKEGYDNAQYLKRMHGDFQPFVKLAEVSDAMRQARASEFQTMCDSHARIVYEYRSGDITLAAYRLRTKNLIYRVQSVN